MEAFFTKLPNDFLMPAGDEDRALLSKIKLGDIVKLKLSRVRNVKFHRKFFALLHFAYEFWDPPVLPDDPEQKWRKHVTPEKNFEQFRKDVTILAGYYQAYYRVNGEVRIEAK